MTVYMTWEDRRNLDDGAPCRNKSHGFKATSKRLTIEMRSKDEVHIDVLCTPQGSANSDRCWRLELIHFQSLTNLECGIRENHDMDQEEGEEEGGDEPGCCQGLTVTMVVVKSPNTMRIPTERNKLSRKSHATQRRFLGI